MHYEQSSPQAKTNLAAIDARLTELDDIFLRFCSQHGYKLSRNLQIWPKRRVWRRDEIDRCLDLVMDVSFQDALDRGFYPEFPWSLYAQGSLHPGRDPDTRLSTLPVFEHVPYSQLSSVLEGGLAKGLQILNTLTQSQILTYGQTAKEIQAQGKTEYEAYLRTQQLARDAQADAPP